MPLLPPNQLSNWQQRKKSSSNMMTATRSPPPFYSISSLSYGSKGSISTKKKKKKKAKKNVPNDYRRRLPLETIQNHRRIFTQLCYDKDSIIIDDESSGKPQPLLPPRSDGDPSSPSTSPDMTLITSVCTADTMSLSFLYYDWGEFLPVDESSKIGVTSSSTELQEDDQSIINWDEEGTNNDDGKKGEQQLFTKNDDDDHEDGAEFWLANNVFRINVSDDDDGGGIFDSTSSTLEVFLPDDESSGNNAARGDDDGVNGEFFFPEDDEFTSSQKNKPRERRGADRVCMHKLNYIVEKLSPRAAGAEELPLSQSSPSTSRRSNSTDDDCSSNKLNDNVEKLSPRAAGAEVVPVSPSSPSTSCRSKNSTDDDCSGNKLNDIVEKLSPRAAGAEEVPLSPSSPSTSRRSKNSTDGESSGNNISSSLASSGPKDSLQTVADKIQLLERRLSLNKMALQAEEEELASRLSSQSTEEEDSLITHMRKVSALSQKCILLQQHAERNEAARLQRHERIESLERKLEVTLGADRKGRLERKLSKLAQEYNGEKREIRRQMRKGRINKARQEYLECVMANCDESSVNLLKNMYPAA